MCMNKNHDWCLSSVIIIIIYLSCLLTRSSLTYPEFSSKVCHNFFCLLGNIVSLPWVIYYEAFYLHVLSSFSCKYLLLFLLFIFPRLPSSADFSMFCKFFHSFSMSISFFLCIFQVQFHPFGLQPSYAFII